MSNVAERSPEDLEIRSISCGDGKEVILEASARTTKNGTWAQPQLN